MLGDVVVPEDPIDVVTPIDGVYDQPSTVDDQVRWLAAAGFNAAVVWARQDLLRDRRRFAVLMQPAGDDRWCARRPRRRNLDRFHEALLLGPCAHRCFLPPGDHQVILLGSESRRQFRFRVPPSLLADALDVGVFQSAAPRLRGQRTLR